MAEERVSIRQATPLVATSLATVLRADGPRPGGHSPNSLCPRGRAPIEPAPRRPRHGGAPSAPPVGQRTCILPLSLCTLSPSQAATSLAASSGNDVRPSEGRNSLTVPSFSVRGTCSLLRLLGPICVG